MNRHVEPTKRRLLTTSSAKLQSELDKLDKQPNETLFDVYIRVVNEKVVGDGVKIF